MPSESEVPAALLDLTAPGPEALFRHGVASGDPLSDAVILWTRVTPDTDGPVEVSYFVSTSADFDGIDQQGTFTTNADRDYTVKIDVDGLEDGTTYYYYFTANGSRSLVGRTKTAPASGTQEMRFAVMSCSSHPHGVFFAYRDVATRPDLDAMLHLGDYIYEYGTGEYGTVRTSEPDHEIITLDDYRMRYAQYRRDAALQAAHQQLAMIHVWDDHETANNSWRDGAENHSDTEGDWADRLAAATQAYYEWMPTREQSHGSLYRSFRFGDLVDLMMLDTRIAGRDEQGGDQAAERQLLGTEQETWLSNELAGSTARWRLLGQQVMMMQFTGNAETQNTANDDGWDGYVDARQRIYDVIDNNDLDNVVVLTGDIHSSWGGDLHPNPFDASRDDAYDPETHANARGVEFVCPGITSPGFPAGLGIAELFADTNPQIHYVDGARRGYIRLIVSRSAVQADWVHFSGIRPEDDGIALQEASWRVRDGRNHIEPTEPLAEGGGPDFANREGLIEAFEADVARLAAERAADEA